MQRGLRCLVVKYGDPGEGRMRVGRKGISARKQKKTFPMGKVFLICSVFRPVGAEEGAQELHHEGKVGADKD